jgi:hypothetical protein
MESIHCHVTRTSDVTPPCIGARGREIKQMGVKGHKILWCLTFESVAAFTTWMLDIKHSVVVRPWIRTDYTWLDGKPSPVWDVEIYDNYRE